MTQAIFDQTAAAGAWPLSHSCGENFFMAKFPLERRRIEWFRNTSEVTFMCMNSGNNCSCLWLIIIIVLLFCCCGNGNLGGNNCGNDCNNNCC